MEVSLGVTALIAIVAASGVITLQRSLSHKKDAKSTAQDGGKYHVHRGAGYVLGMAAAFLFTSFLGMALFHFAHYYARRERIEASTKIGKGGARWESDRGTATEGDRDGEEEPEQTLAEALPDYETYWMIGYNAHHEEESYHDSCGISDPLVYQAWRLGKEYAVKEIMDEAKRRKEA